jgi:abortive infection bacteriophage resistance protein
MKYDKPPLTFDQQIDRLIERGLQIPNRNLALKTLQAISYYRFSAYFLPFQKETNKFNDGTKFEDVLQLYEFDRKLRLIFLDAIEWVEVAFRTHLTYYLAHQKTFGPWGYIDAVNFEGHFQHQQWIDKVKEDVRISKEVFIRHFFDKYSENKDLPLWMMTEVISLNRLSIFFRFLKKDYRNGLAQEFYGLPSQVLASWLESLTYIRNVCAHHSRLWNRDLPVSPKIPRGTKQWQSYSKKVFNVVMVFKNMIPQTDRWSKFVGDLASLIDSYPQINLKAMGFPDNWNEVLLDGKK